MVQAAIMICSVVLVGILGTIKAGGLTKVLEYAEEGGRLDFKWVFKQQTTFLKKFFFL